ncbi:MAG: T9SS type A sorting domain-containing protein [Ignavibacteriaceae bacterium]
MKKMLYLIVFLIIAVSTSYSQVTTLWEKSAATSTNPVWNTGSVVRGLSYGQVGADHRMYVVNRHGDFGGKQIFIYNAITGDSVGTLDTTGLSGGTLVINDVEVSTDGKIFVCNLAVGGFFKVYKYDTEASAPAAVIDFDAAGKRLGDKITVTGSTSDNSIIIWAPSATADGEVLKFTTTDNGVTFTPQTVNIGALVTFSSAAVGPYPNGDFIFNAHGANAQKFTSTGTQVGTIPTGVLAVGGSASRFLNTLSGNEYIVANALGTGFEQARVIMLPGGDPATASLFANTSTLGTNSSGGLGDISTQQINDYLFNVYVLSTNNGFGAYQIDLRPQLAGDYYIGAAGTGPGGTDPDFVDLREAFDVLNSSSFTADCNFYITSDIFESFTPAVGYGLGLAINPEPYTVTFKPYTGVQPVITLAYPLDGTSGPSGALVIGLPSEGNIAWDDMRTTKNIVIDGSNTVGGTTRDLTIQNETTSHRNGFPMTIVGDVSNLIIKNTNIYYKAAGLGSTSGNLFLGAVQVRSRNYLGINWVPNNILIENNHLSSNFEGVALNSQGYVTYQSGTPLPLDYPYDITLVNNVIEGKRRGIALYRAGSHDLIGNEIILNQDIAGNVSNEAIYAVDVDTNSVVNIYNNIISKVSSMTSGATVGNTAMSIESFGTYNIYNNMIYGFDLTAPSPDAFVRGIKNSSPSAVLNLSYNSIYMDNLPVTGTGTVTYYGIYLTEGTNNLLNNIVFCAETDFEAFCIYREGLNGTVTSNYNNFYPVPMNNVGYWNNAPTPTILDWQTASGQDANSVSKEVFFVAANDLHLTGSSLGDFDLAGTPVAGITTDIDGDTRDAQFPYMGADEGSVPLGVITIAQAREDLNGDLIPDRLGQIVTIEGVVNSPNYQTVNHSYYIWDGTAGITEILFGTTSPVLNLGDAVRITGEIGHFRGLTQIQPASAADITILSSGNPVPGPVVLTLAAYKADPEAYEGTLVGFVALNKVGGTWPAPGGSATLQVSDGTDTVDYRIDSDTDLDDNPEPTWPVDLLGLGSQFSSGVTVYNDGYQILPRYYATDILPPGTIPVELTSFTASVVNRKVNLTWTTASELNNHGFEIQRSSNGEFYNIGFVPGAGTTTDEKSYSFIDDNVTYGVYTYRLKQVDFDGSFAYSKTVEVDVTTPLNFELAQNYPNPFNPATVIEYSIASPANVTLTVFTILGEQVAVLVNNQFTEAGKYAVQFNASGLASGAYIYRLQAGEFVSTKKMLLTK